GLPAVGAEPAAGQVAHAPQGVLLDLGPDLAQLPGARVGGDLGLELLDRARLAAEDGRGLARLEVRGEAAEERVVGPGVAELDRLRVGAEGAQPAPLLVHE